MDPRLLRAYNDELGYLREAAREFGEEHEAAAGYLGLKTPNDPDPYVERLLEGVAFLAARVNLKQQDQFPEFTQHLLQAIQPDYLAPTPSMCVLGLVPKHDDEALAAGVVVPRETMVTMSSAGDESVVRYRTGQDVTLYPLKIEAAEYLPSRSSVARQAAAAGVKAEAGLRIRFAAAGALPLRALAPDLLPLYLDGSESVPGELYRQLLGDAVAVVAEVPGSTSNEKLILPLPEPVGFSDDEALLPHEGRSFRGYRLLAEYFACPEKFLFAGLRGLDKAFARAEAYCEVVILFRRSAAALHQAVTEANLRLFATPAINLFEYQVDRISIVPHEHEFQVMPNRAHPLDFEVFRILSVKAHDKSGSDHVVKPMFAFGSLLYDVEEALFYVSRMRPHRISSREQRRRQRPDYVSTETWISLTAPGRPQRLDDIREISVRALVTNRELPETTRFARKSNEFRVEAPLVAAVTELRAPTRARPPLGLGEAAWRAVGQLIPNFASLAAPGTVDAAALREHLAIYGQVDDPLMRKQVDGIQSLEARRVTRRVLESERTAFARGIALSIRLDDSSFERGRMFLFAAVIDRFLGEYVSINSFTETVFESQDQGEFARWAPRTGLRPTI